MGVRHNAAMQVPLTEDDLFLRQTLGRTLTRLGIRVVPCGGSRDIAQTQGRSAPKGAIEQPPACLPLLPKQQLFTLVGGHDAELIAQQVDLQFNALLFKHPVQTQAAVIAV